MTAIEIDVKTTIESLAKKAGETKDSQDALRFSQAALNLAHVQATIVGANVLEKSNH